RRSRAATGSIRSHVGTDDGRGSDRRIGAPARLAAHRPRPQGRARRRAAARRLAGLGAAGRHERVLLPGAERRVGGVRRPLPQGHPAGLHRRQPRALRRRRRRGRAARHRVRHADRVVAARVARAVAAPQLHVRDRRGRVDPDLRRLVRLRHQDHRAGARLRGVLPGPLQHGAVGAHRAAGARQRGALARRQPRRRGALRDPAERAAGNDHRLAARRRLRVPRPRVRRDGRRQDRRRISHLRRRADAADLANDRRHDPDGPHVARDRPVLPAAVRARHRATLGPDRRRGGPHMTPTRRQAAIYGTVPFLLVIATWAILPHLVHYPAYMLPSIGAVAAFARDSILDGSLLQAIVASLARLAIGFVIGMALAIPAGLAIALNRHVADMARPVLSFLQAIAGIAWVPLTIIWCGSGNGSVVFVIANTIFFAALYNTVLGVESIPLALHRAVRSHGGRGVRLVTNLILPGA